MLLYMPSHHRSQVSLNRQLWTMQRRPTPNAQRAQRGRFPCWYWASGPWCKYYIPLTLKQRSSALRTSAWECWPLQCLCVFVPYLGLPNYSSLIQTWWSPGASHLCRFGYFKPRISGDQATNDPFWGLIILSHGHITIYNHNQASWSWWTPNFEASWWKESTAAPPVKLCQGTLIRIIWLRYRPVEPRHGKQDDQRPKADQRLYVWSQDSRDCARQEKVLNFRLQ